MVSRRSFLSVAVTVTMSACATSPRNKAPQLATARLTIVGMT
jgi:hypothetical protein